MNALKTAVIATLAAAGLAAAEEPLVYRPGSPTREQVDRGGRPVLGSGGERLRYDSEPERRLPVPPALEVEGRERALAGVSVEWTRSAFGTGIGYRGLHVADLDADGSPEIVASASPSGFGENQFWYVLGFDGSGYEHEWVSAPLGTIRSLIVEQVDGDPALEVLVGVGGKVLVYDGATHAVQQTITTTASSVRGLTLADVDRDLAREVVFCDASRLYVVDLATGATEHALDTLGGDDLAVGNVDDDPDLEVLIARGSNPGLVVNGRTHAVEWTNPWGFGSLVRAGDVDGDGRAEAVAGFAWYTIRVFDVESRSLRGSIATDLDVDALRLFDLDGDGRPEIVYGDGQWGSVYVHDGNTLALRWSIDNPDSGVTDVAIGNTDGDPQPELLWGAGFNSTGEDHLYVADTLTRQRDWQSLDFNGPFQALAHGDVDADGRPELLYGSFESNSGYDDGIWFVHDAATHVQEFASTPGWSGWTGLQRLRLANVDGDPQQEVFVAMGHLYTGKVYAYDGLTHALERTFTLEDGNIASNILLADLDRDGTPELVASSRKEHTGATGTYVYVFDPATGALEWRSPSLLDGWDDLALLRAANLDGDPALEIVVGNRVSYSGDGRGQLLVIDGTSHAIAHLGNQAVTALDTPDLDGDGVAELLVGTSAGALRVLDPATGAVKQSLPGQAAALDAVVGADADRDGDLELVVAVQNELLIRDPLSSVPVWRSGVIGSGVGVNDSLLVADIDRDGHTELVASVGYTGLQVFEVEGTLGTALCAAGAQAPEQGGTLAFEVRLSAPSAEVVTVSYTTASGTADSGVDFEPRAGTLEFAPGVTSQPVTVPVLADTVHEGDETMELVLSAPTGAQVSCARATGTIVDDDDVPRLSVADASVLETGGSVPLVVTLSNPTASEVRASFSTRPGTATEDVDYLRSAGTLVIPAGQTSHTISVTILDDTAAEGPESFGLDLFPDSGAAYGDTYAEVALQDDEPAPVLSVADLSVTEGDGAPASATFRLLLSTPSQHGAGVRIDTAAGTATPGLDYLGVGEWVSFAPGVVEQTKTVTVVADLATEPSETFFLDLSAAQGLTLARPRATATILDNDPLSVTTASASVVVGRALGVTVKGGPGAATDWVGLHRVGSPVVSAPLSWQYLNGTHTPPTTGTSWASLSFVMPQEGALELRFYASNGYGLLATSAPVTVTPAPAQVVGVEAVEFGAVRVGVPKDGTVTVKNTGAGLLHGTATVEGSGFALAGPAAYEIPAGGSATVPVRFQPTGVGPHQGTLRLASDGGEATVTLRGSGVQPVLSVGSTQLAAGGSLLVGVSGGPGSPRDWVGLYRVGEPDSAYRGWRYLNGLQTPPATGLSSASFSFPMAVEGGSYELRLFADNGYTRLATSPAFTVVAPLITVSPTAIARWQSVQVSVANGPAFISDWVGLFRPGAADWEVVDWMYLNGTKTPPPSGMSSATFSSSISTSGRFEFRFYENFTFKRLATSEVVDVSGAPSLALSTTQLSFGTVASGRAARQTVRVTNGGDADLRGTAFASGSPAFTVRNATYQLPPGASHELVVEFFPEDTAGSFAGTLFLTGNTSSASVSLTGQATAGPRLDLSATVGSPGSTIQVQVAAGTGNPNDWIGLFPLSAPDGGLYLDWKYLNGLQTPGGGTAVSFTLPQQPGHYQFRLFANNSYDQLAASHFVTVTGSGAGVFAAASRTAGKLDVAVTGGPGNLADWVGVYAVGAPDGALLGWAYLTGGTHRPLAGLPEASLTLARPAAAGSYEVRYFSDNGYTLLARSQPFTLP